MSRVEALASIEARLRNCRDSATSIGENALAYMIDVAIAEAQEYADREPSQSRGHLTPASAPVAKVKAMRVG